jgi:hypothetical protein
LGNETKRLLSKELTQFILFSKYLKENNESSFLTQPWAKDRVLDRTFFNGDFIRTLKKVQTEFLSWLEEMASQERAFTPFLLHDKRERVFDLVTDFRQRKLMVYDSNYDLFNNRLNSQEENMTGAIEQQFTGLFYLATQQLVSEKFNIE